MVMAKRTRPTPKFMNYSGSIQGPADLSSQRGFSLVVERESEVERSPKFDPKKTRQAASLREFSLRLPSIYKLHQTAQGNSRGTFGDPRFGLFHPGGPRNVEMDPWSVFGKFLEEHGGEDSAAPTAAGIDHVGDVGFEVFLVFVVERKAPHFLACLFVGVREALIHLVVAGEDSGIYVAESHDYGAGQGGGIHEMSAAELAGVAEAVGEDEASFGVGVDDLDRLAGHGNLHVARLLRLA